MLQYRTLIPKGRDHHLVCSRIPLERNADFQFLLFNIIQRHSNISIYRSIMPPNQGKAEIHLGLTSTALRASATPPLL
ncbi:hypothetical protein EYF80_008215 [Liparis tanakae]|uniref:Uncharacterized protein n=1 Tax=Liparis tanakae TaxID=230148 RepID=A0A4Z2IW34_9TELE|nr:hypothetical protein EYF80_008215 [Liparis tanakae]